MAETITKNSVNPSDEEYTKIEKTITDQVFKRREKKIVQSEINATIAGMLIGFGIIGFAILNSAKAIVEPYLWMFAIFIWGTGLGVLLFIIGLLSSIKLSKKIMDNEAVDRLLFAQKEFVENHGLEITDIELSYLNFPQIGVERREGFCGAAEVFDKNARALKKVTLHQNAGELILCDENGTSYSHKLKSLNQKNMLARKRMSEQKLNILLIVLGAGLTYFGFKECKKNTMPHLLR